MPISSDPPPLPATSYNFMGPGVLYSLSLVLTLKSASRPSRSTLWIQQLSHVYWLDSGYSFEIKFEFKKGIDSEANEGVMLGLEMMWAKVTCGIVEGRGGGSSRLGCPFPALPQGAESGLSTDPSTGP